MGGGAAQETETAGLGSGFRFDNSWRRKLPGTYVVAEPDPAPAPQLLALNEDLCHGLGLDPEVLRRHPAWFAGGALPDGAEPIALAYAGHQFGGFSAQLGDGRAHLLGEHLDPQGRRWDLQLKGSGRTVFSRGGDGKAALGPMLREYLISEAMAALGVRTTRSLAVALTGEQVLREDGPLRGAVVARIAASHLRIGSFQFLAARGDREGLQHLLDYAIARHDPDLIGTEGRAMAFFHRVIARQTDLIAEWMGLGFVHGVMNTDNMTISGETIDYGPCAFMEAYAPGTVFSSIDRQGRYAYANQPRILPWNLARLAESLLPLLGETDEIVDQLNDILTAIEANYRKAWLKVMARKLCLDADHPALEVLADGLLEAMSGQGADWTLSFRRLADLVEGREEAFFGLFADPTRARSWAEAWRAAQAERYGAELAQRLRAVNPLVIPRNHRVEEALSAASKGDMAPFEALLEAVRRPFAASKSQEAYALPAPLGFGSYVTFCGT